MALIDNLISYYKLDENAANTDVVDSHGSNDGTASTNTANLYDASGKISSCFDLTKSNVEYVTVSDDDTLDVTNYLSINMWIYADSYPNASNGIIQKGSISSNQGVISINISASDNHATFRLNGQTSEGSGACTAPGGSLGTGAWHMVTVTYDKVEEEQKIYVDGDLKNTESYSTSITVDANPLYIGTYYSTAYTFDGKIDEVGFWGKTLTSTEVTSLYNSGDGLPYSSFDPNITVEPSAQTLSLSGETSVAVVLDNPLSLSSSLTGLAPVPVLTVLPSTLELTSVGNVPPILQEPDTLILKLIFQTPSLNILNNTWRNPNYGTKSTKIISNLDIPDGIGGVMNLLPQDYSNVLSKKRVGLGM